MNRLKQEIMAAALGAATPDGEQAVTRSYRFGEQFAGFSGHFPGSPILPAIVQMLTAITMIEEQTGTGQRLLAVDDAKFLNPIRPDQEILVRHQMRTVGGKLLHEARLSVAGKPASTFLLQLAPEEDQP